VPDVEVAAPGGYQANVVVANILGYWRMGSAACDRGRSPMSESDLERPEPDSEDQRWSAAEDGEAQAEKTPADLPLDVNEADAAEQRQEVKLDEDDYR
jgi:hypothetical protein